MKEFPRKVQRRDDKMTFHWFIRRCRMQCSAGFRLFCSPTYRSSHCICVSPYHKSFISFSLSNSNPSWPEQLQIEFQNSIFSPFFRVGLRLIFLSFGHSLGFHHKWGGLKLLSVAIKRDLIREQKVINWCHLCAPLSTSFCGQKCFSITLESHFNYP